MQNLKGALKKKWGPNKKKESQTTRNRPKAQFSLSPKAKARLKELAKRTSGGNMSGAIEKLIVGK